MNKFFKYYFSKVFLTRKKYAKTMYNQYLAIYSEVGQNMSCKSKQQLKARICSLLGIKSF